MKVNQFLEKVSWKLHRVNYKIVLFSFEYNGSSSSGNFIFLGVVKDFDESSLLSWSFRLPNKTHVTRFVTDHWDFLFLRNYLYKKYESLIDKELWTKKGLTKWELKKLRFLSRLF